MVKKVTISRSKIAQMGRPSEVTDSIVRFWEGLEVKDANFSIVVDIDYVDYEHAEAQNIFACAFVQAVKRTHRAEHAIFTRTVAYVDLIVDNKPRAVYRFVLSAAARRVIEQFDKTKTAAERKALAEKAGSTFTLKQPNRSQSLNGLRDASTKSRKQRQASRTILVKGEAVCAPRKTKVAAARAAKKASAAEMLKNRRKYGASILELSDLRNATGRVQFKVGKVNESIIPKADKATKVEEPTH